MSIALGCVGMNLDDFCRCTPFEFKGIYDEWFNRTKDAIRREWEIGRMISLNVLAPYSKKSLKPTDICRFSWDDEDTSVPKGTSSYERMKEVEKRG